MILPTTKVRHQCFYWTDMGALGYEMVLGVRRLKSGRIKVQCCDYRNDEMVVRAYDLYEESGEAVEAILDHIDSRQRKLRAELQRLDEVKKTLNREHGPKLRDPGGMLR